MKEQVICFLKMMRRINMSKVFYDPMKEIDQSRDLETFRKHVMYFEALTKFIRGLHERLPTKVLFVQKNF